jgi:N-glycosylase/DNA lyase
MIRTGRITTLNSEPPELNKEQLGSALELSLSQTTTPFNLDHTLDCGQVFRWNRVSDWWQGVIGESQVRVRQLDSKLIFESRPELPSINTLWSYFRLDDDLPRIHAELGKDAMIHSAIDRYPGLRLIRQDPWECLISYVCSRRTKIEQIKRIAQKLSRLFGRKIEGAEDYIFPTAQALASARVEDIERCDLPFGRREAHEIQTIAKRTIDLGINLNELKSLGYEEAKERLLSFYSGYGVGEKVADCVCLFALEKLEAIPIDVWIKRALLEYYPHLFDPLFLRRVSSKRSLTSAEYRHLSLVGRRYFGEYAGYAQEYLYYYRRVQQT